ncbi:hypothetical protein AABB24_005527 [Solanum stoloniferum]|uniref:Uncharacterized protein n=1 Tax=Solanum stoloniferum TaxID=62892 RepID=A0ABD2UY32_9SOLN
MRDPLRNLVLLEIYNQYDIIIQLVSGMSVVRVPLSIRIVFSKTQLLLKKVVCGCNFVQYTMLVVCYFVEDMFLYICSKSFPGNSCMMIGKMFFYRRKPHTQHLFLL